jgi:hypothetical protein
MFLIGGIPSGAGAGFMLWVGLQMSALAFAADPTLGTTCRFVSVHTSRSHRQRLDVSRLPSFGFPLPETLARRVCWLGDSLPSPRLVYELLLCAIPRSLHSCAIPRCCDTPLLQHRRCLRNTALHGLVECPPAIGTSLRRSLRCMSLLTAQYAAAAAVVAIVAVVAVTQALLRAVNEFVGRDVKLAQLLPLMVSDGVAVDGMIALSEGYLFVSLCWSATLLHISEREFLRVRVRCRCEHPSAGC